MTEYTCFMTHPYVKAAFDYYNRESASDYSKHKVTPAFHLLGLELAKLDNQKKALAESEATQERWLSGYHSVQPGMTKVLDHEARSYKWVDSKEPKHSTNPPSPLSDDPFGSA